MSELLYLIDDLGASIVQLRDIVNLNKPVQVQELLNFFCLMEIYGAQASSDKESFFHQDSHYEENPKDKNDVLSELRMLALNNLTQISFEVQNY